MIDNIEQPYFNYDNKKLLRFLYLKDIIFSFKLFLDIDWKDYPPNKSSVADYK
jgi:hypothetical protein